MYPVWEGAGRGEQESGREIKGEEARGGAEVEVLGGRGGTRERRESRVRGIGKERGGMEGESGGTRGKHVRGRGEERKGTGGRRERKGNGDTGREIYGEGKGER